MRTIRWTPRAAHELAALDSSPASFDRLLEVLAKLAMLPGMARRVPDRPDVRRFLCGRHYVYFREQSGGIVILRLTSTRRHTEHL